MIKGLEAVLLSSENAANLAEFYREKVGLKQGEEMEIGDKGEKGFDFQLEGANLYILDHSDVKGKSKEPARVMFNLEVDDIEKEVKRLKDEGVKAVADIYHVEGYGLIATFEDPDANYFQFVQVRAS
ncbi:hypothetical protein A3D81_03140 [Candidatus Curtissbacteria bacterium RIFCSPHIGHO2_02_FULL_40_17]|uniref:VOC domain-containing protein n=4 Tax=Candidatus Curtissiibacteriota TaxID=1752717 RepID=A0A1F5GJI1_9BACT|nr:MAG: hypothetical protein A2693_02605 [Candidatus Curtissbacteria bacterium RIFCSPHIGHO2_01_FULL_40_12]OGD92036.1 MAG: hypothetical protein A3D81_03140 [Candidatus Curtissbacteria bacterium RIFCSPHIGHO2_02_FULL_40_17]OGE05607.1 MAG: hypothetical protein A3F45_00115 [Candidatus Curtissbacteria bacterium RIFCSPHIGHO2_12_FULL_41_17]OGE07343.1 MAG: hypothetical protein A3I53_01970 [Candidatus Curtissbacteria bacterium RIFCSPLOWO2_02_FULL_40_13b]